MVNQKSKGSSVMSKTSNQSCLTPLISLILEQGWSSYHANALGLQDDICYAALLL